MREGGENDETGMVSDIEGVRSLGGREMSSSMRDWICVSVTVVVVVVAVALMVAMGVVVLMVVVGIVVLVMVVIVLGIGVVEMVRYCV